MFIVIQPLSLAAVATPPPLWKSLACTCVYSASAPLSFFALGYSDTRFYVAARACFSVYIAALLHWTSLYPTAKFDGGTSERGRGRSKEEQYGGERCGGGSCKDTKARERRDGQTGKPIAMEIASTVAYPADQNSFNQVEITTSYVSIVTHYIQQHWLYSQKQIRIVSKLSTFRLMNKCKGTTPLGSSTVYGLAMFDSTT